MKILDVAVYTRVSTKHEEQITSIDNQKKHYTDYCEKNNYNLVKLYTDEGLSATSPNRKEYLEMLYDAGLDFERDINTNKILYFKLSDRKPKFKMIITKDVSRFARNVNAIDLARQLREKGVFVLFENAGFSTDDNDWELRLSLLLTFSQQESLDRSKKVAFAYKQRAANGKFHMTRNLYGYRYDKETKEVEVIEDEAIVVKKIFDLYINEGYGVKNISNYLNEKGIKTQEGSLWTPSSVRRLLRNEKYIGNVILNKYTNSGITSSNKKILRPEDEWKRLEDVIPAIIDKETWSKSQEIMKKRVDQMSEGSLTGSRKIKNIFYNKVFCGVCGASYVRVVTTKNNGSKQANYMCSNRRKRNSCSNKMISHNILTEKITEFAQQELPKILGDKKVLYEKLISIEQSLLQMKIKMSSRTINSAKEKIAEIDKEIDKFLTAFAKSNSTVVSVIEKKIEQLEEEKSNLNKTILENETVSLQNEMDKLNEFKLKLLTMVKPTYNFDEALTYLAKVTAIGRDLTFNVVADEKLEPIINIDIHKVGKGNPEKVALEMLEKLKKLNETTK